MISTSNVTLRVGKKALFEDVSIKFIEGNCYGLIGANGAGKSTFLRILSGQLEPTNGEVIITPGQRLSFLQQDHFKYDAYPVLDTVIMGNARLYEIMKEKEAIYMKEDFSEEDGVKAAELEGEFATMNGWEAESDAANLLNGLGIETDLHYKQMADLTGAQKVKVLLAQALFGNPDILLLDEPTNGLDPAGIQEMRELICSLPETLGITVLISSHLLSEIDQMASHVGIINQGALIFQDSLSVLHEHSRSKMLLHTSDDQTALQYLKHSGISCHWQNGRIMLNTLEDNRIMQAVSLLVNSGIGILRLEEQQMSLEEIFLHLTGKQVSL